MMAMRLERKKNTIRYLVWGMSGRAVTLLGPFVIRSMIIERLGAGYLGLGSLFTSILQVLNMAELGIGSAVAYCMYAPIANDDTEVICALLGAFRKIYKIIGLVILGAGLLLSPFLGLLINGDVPADINIHLLYLLYLLNASISYLMCAYRNVLFSAFQREDILSKIHSALLIAGYVVQIIILSMFRDYYLYYAVVPIISILDNTVVYFLSKEYFPRYIPQGALPQQIKGDIKEKVSGIVISKFCGLTRNAFDSIIISSFIGLRAVAIYGNYYYIMSNLSALLVIGVTAMRAGIGNSIAMDTEEKNHKDIGRFSFIYMWVAGWCSICLLCLYQPFMELWVHKENMFPFYMVILFSVYFFGLCVGDIIDAYSGAVGLWWENRKRTMCEAVCNLLLNIVLGYLFGVAGVLLATVITIFVFNFFWKAYILYDRYFVSYRFFGHIRINMFYMVVTIMAGAVSLTLCAMVDLKPIYALFFRGVVCVFVPNLIFFLAYGRLSVYKDAERFIKTLFGRRRKRDRWEDDMPI